MTLTGTQRRELETLGWSTVREKARRPRIVSPTDILYVGRDMSFDGQNPERRLTELEHNR